MSEKYKITLVYLITSVFMVLSIFLVIHKIYWALLLPVGIIIALLYVYSLDMILWLVVFSTPLAINVQDLNLGVGISLPTEPLLLGVLIIFFIKLLFSNNLDRRFVKHPVTIAILLNLSWLIITSMTSQLPMVSVKFMLARLWFVIPLYFVGFSLFRKFENVKLFSWLYVSSLLLVVIYTIYNHSLYGFNETEGHWVMTPFYNDHTAYGAILAMFIPVMFGFGFDRSGKHNFRIIAFLLCCILGIALYLSFSRAAWISILFALIAYLLILFRIRFRWILASIALALVVLFSFKFEILEILEKNKQASSANFIEHIESISNISSDASNLERVNRWQSALRMFRESPVVGWGPGTYQFEYAPFQRAMEKTAISTNFGDRGNAHSEYIGPLAESGLIGMLTFLAIIVLIIRTGIHVHRYAARREVRLLSLITVLSFITYAVHSLMNNFLDSDKASVPFWGFAAIIVALDIFHRDSVNPLAGKEKSDAI